MKKSFLILFTFILCMILSQKLMAQSIDEGLGCSTDQCGFFIINDLVDTIFTCLGNGKVSIGPGNWATKEEILEVITPLGGYGLSLVNNSGQARLRMGIKGFDSGVINLGDVDPNYGILLNPQISSFFCRNGVVFGGDFGSGLKPPIDAGSRMMWYPKKAAFRAGHVSHDEWDDSNIGNYSTAIGYSTVASGDFSASIGERTNASGIRSLEMGSNSVASATLSIYLGNSNVASNISAMALGASTEASGIVSTSMGNLTVASGATSTAMGLRSVAEGPVATAMGNETIASGPSSTAMGYETNAQGMNSTAMGTSTTASGSYCTAMGYGTNAKSPYSMAIGKYNDDDGSATGWDPDEYIFMIGNGTSDTDRSNLLTVKKNGDLWIQGALTDHSDLRLKRNITELKASLDKLKQLHGVHFYWKNTETRGNKKQIGLIAQDVEKVFPELVGENGGYKTTNYIGLIPVLIEAIKDQQQMIDDLKAQLEQLQN